MDRKSISLPLDVFDLIDMIKSEYESETRRRHTYPSIIFMLSQYYLNNKNKVEPVVVSEPDTELKKELKETNSFIREAFMKMIDNAKPAPQFIVSGGGGSIPLEYQGVMNTPQPQLPEVVEATPLTDDEIARIQTNLLNDEDDGNFVDELDNIVEESNGFISPSLVAKINGNDLKGIESIKHRDVRMGKRLKKSKKKIKRIQSQIEKDAKESLQESIDGLTPPVVDGLTPPPS